jgi:hypothetical protein
MLVALQLVGVAVTPLNVTVLVPWVAPNVVPLMVVDVPTGPAVGARLLIFGLTVKVTPLLGTPLTATTTGPVVAPEGTVAIMLPAPQDVGVAATPLNINVLVPWVAPKLEPVTVTEVPTGPGEPETLLMAGGTIGSGAIICES